jgi:hypothetical protein
MSLISKAFAPDGFFGEGHLLHLRQTPRIAWLQRTKLGQRLSVRAVLNKLRNQQRQLFYIIGNGQRMYRHRSGLSQGGPHDRYLHLVCGLIATPLQHQI